MQAAKSALHEIEGLIWLLIASVLLAGAAVVEAVFRSAERQLRVKATDR
jgi:hypothetical protein